jgi:acyl-homoserine lactone acylase PvdQ
MFASDASAVKRQDTPFLTTGTGAPLRVAGDDAPPMPRRPFHLPIVAAFVAAIALPGAAEAALIRAETILPPGQSGFVSPTGVTAGTGSPHLNDQLPLFVDFRRKPATFDLPGDTEKPRPDVTIVRDAYGVPAIRAQEEQGMWWGAGYAVAQDRLFQLELFRRATTGRLAEILGSGYLDDDLIARRDFYTAGERAEMLARLSPALRARIASYRDGVNAWINHVRATPQDLPGEFAALGVPLTDWTEDDSAAIGVFLARTVPSGSGVELQNLRALRSIGAAAFDRLLPLRTHGRLPTIPREEGRFASQPGRTIRQERAALRRTVRASAGWQLPGARASAAARSNVAAGLIGRVGGSYMFATTRASDGHAFLFNGPQLGYSVPELFVELELHAPGFDLRGVTAAGVPLIGIGYNGKVAWGFTSGLSDEDDLYAEDLTDTERYRFDGRVRAMDCRDETFAYRSPPTDALSFPDRVPGAGEQTQRICRTHHGPVELRAGKQAYARRYAIWGRELETIEGLSLLNAAGSIGDVDAAMQQVTWNENVMAIDSGGNMGFWHPGLHPLRPTGYDERLPYPGTGEAEWRGLLDRKRTPRVINPKQGFLFNWNNVPSEGWTSGDAEASERLTGRYHRATWLSWLARDVAREPSFERMQGAVVRAGTIAQQRPLAARKLRVARRGASGRAAQVLDAILAWDGSYHAVDAAGTVDPGVAIWEAFKDEAEDLALDRLASPLGAAREVAGTTGTSHEFDITNGEAFALRSLSRSGLRRAAHATFARLERRYSTDEVARWREPRRMYDVEVQGAAAKPDLPFFDRGTYEQLVELGPG